MKHTIEKAWTTIAGFPAVVIMTGTGHRCGYVGVPPGHPLHGVEYNELTLALPPPKPDTPVGDRGVMTLFAVAMKEELSTSPEVVFDVHGSLTFSKANHEGYPAAEPDDLWWFGYDCAHSQDAPSPEYLAQQRERYPDKPYMWATYGGIHRSQEYCEACCEYLAVQILTRTRNRWQILWQRARHALKTFWEAR